ncbi:MAG: transposase [Bacilli bacterium]|nr:transposase [Bacilli bacterium]
MALKGQKFKKYSIKEKEKIVEEYNKGISSSYLEKEYGISNHTIRQWKYKLRKNGTLINKKRGRINEQNLTKEDWKERYEILKKYQAFLKAQREKK